MEKDNLTIENAAEFLQNQKYLIIRQQGDTLVQTLAEDIECVIVHNTERGKEDITQTRFTRPGHTDMIRFRNFRQRENIPHRHNAFILMILLNGSINHHVGSHLFRYTKGHCCFLNENVDHQEIYREDTEVVFFIFKKRFLKQFFLTEFLHPEQEEKVFQSVSSFILDGSFHSGDARKIYYDFIPIDVEKSCIILKKHVENLETSLASTETGSTFVFLSELCRLFADLWCSTHFMSTRIQVDSSQAEFLNDKLLQIIDYYHGRLTRAQIARLLNYNGEYLNTVIKKYSGKTITRACDESLVRYVEMLLKQNYSVEKIMCELRITNRTRFFRIFKEYTGVTPHQFKKIFRVPRPDLINGLSLNLMTITHKNTLLTGCPVKRVHFSNSARAVFHR